MVAIIVAYASSLASTASSALAKLRSTPFLRLSFVVALLYSLIKWNHMAHTLARFTLDLTRLVQIEPPEISFTALVEWKEDILTVGVTEKDVISQSMVLGLSCLGSKMVGLFGL
ncbi:hypothetical protein U1Q18_026961 [Sarracenia purpurea var. burkii]